jgi:hypothetical protein
MPKHCKLIDPLKGKSIEKPFGLNAEGYPIFDSIRLLTGTVDVENKATEQVTKLRWCQLSQKTKRLKASSISNLVDQIFDGDLTVSDFATYLGKGGRENMVFWEDIKGELCLCLVAEKQERHLHAFLHLYRVLERISVALPLVYASTKPDYKKAMALLHL